MLRIIKEHQKIGSIVFKLAQNDLVKTYRGAALGWAWAIIKPTVMIAVYWYIFSVGSLQTSRQINDYPFFLWLLAGLVPWFYISEMITQGSSAMRAYSHLVTKMSFPASSISTFVSLSKLYVNLAITGITIIAFLLAGFTPTIYYLQLPFYILVMFTMMTFWSILAAPLSAISRDFENLIKSMIPAVFWLSGVVWDPSGIEEPLYRWFYKLNPVTYLTTGYRDTFIQEVWFFQKEETIYFLILTGVLAVLANIMYNKLRTEIPDVL